MVIPVPKQCGSQGEGQFSSARQHDMEISVSNFFAHKLGDTGVPTQPPSKDVVFIDTSVSMSHNKAVS